MGRGEISEKTMYYQNSQKRLNNGLLRALVFVLATMFGLGGVLGQPVATPPGKEALARFLERETAHAEKLSPRLPQQGDSVEKWRTQRRRELQEMLGLWPMPPRADLKATITGTLEKNGLVVEKLHFQSLPGLYVTGNFYRPKTITGPLPTILYVCGHSRVKIAGVAYGAKTAYQHHGIWFAREGYCCLVIDTLQLGEIEGIHHGTYSEKMWWWIGRGYTPAGVEAWNSMRALDYLATRTEVDMKRIGVTGRSGGGAYTWWLGALDDRPACLAPIAGITDLRDHVMHGCIEGHCDCMYMVNGYAWDFADVAALVAPRPLLLGNTDKDNIFPLTGVTTLHTKLASFYRALNAADKLGLLITEGPHKDTQDLQVPVFRWMNRWLKGSDEPITRVAAKEFTPQELKVFRRLPADARNQRIHETFVVAARQPPVPGSRGEWERSRQNYRAVIENQCLRNLRARGHGSAECVLSKPLASWVLETWRYQQGDFGELPFCVLRAADTPQPARLLVWAVDQEEWTAWVGAVGPWLPADWARGSRLDLAMRARVFAALRDKSSVLVVVPPRGVGPTRWANDERGETHVRRRFVLLGRTVEEGQYWDIRSALAVLCAPGNTAVRDIVLEARGKFAGIALLAAADTPQVSKVVLHQPITSFREGSIFQGIEKVLELSQAAAMVFPRRLVLYDTDPWVWKLTMAVAKLYDNDNPPLEFRGARRVSPSP